MKVCILTSSHPVFDLRIFYKEAKTLAQAGYEISLIARRDGYIRKEHPANINIILLPIFRFRLLRIVVTPLILFKYAIRQKADIYHFHDCHLVPVCFLLKLFVKKAKIIYDIHEDMPKDLFNMEWIPRWLIKPLSSVSNFFEKMISKKFDYLIAATPAIAQNFKQGEVSVINNYPILGYFNKVADTLPNINKKYYTLVYYGHITRVRGSAEIVKALGLVNSNYNVRMKLMGRFLRNNFYEETVRLYGWKKVIYLPWLPYKKMVDHLLESDFGMMCYYPFSDNMEALPIKMFEYMAAGVPLIASNFPLWKEIIEGNDCGVCVNPLDPEEIAKAVEYLIENSTTAKKMADNGRRAVLEKYNWDKESGKLLQIYDNLFKK